MSQKAKKGGGKKGASRSSSLQISRRMRIYLAALFLLIFLAATLLLLAKLRQSFLEPPEEQRAEVVTSETVAPEDLRVEIESALLRGGYGPDRIRQERVGTVLAYWVQSDGAEAELVEQLARRLKRYGNRVHLQRQDAAVAVVLGGTEVLRLLFVSAPAPPPTEPPLSAARPRVAIVLDDLGRDIASAQRLADIDIPVTFAVMPNTERSREVATLAHRQGREVMIHIPMEPQSYPKANPGSDALFTGLASEEIQARFRSYLERVPFAVGGNNHMGSRFTEDRRGMAVVLDLMAAEGLYFVDSRTTGRSVGREAARAAKVPFATRDIFLDNERDVALIRAQIAKLVAKAKKNGQALGIGHPYPETLKALELEASRFGEAGVDVVPASALLERWDDR